MTITAKSKQKLYQNCPNYLWIKMAWNFLFCVGRINSEWQQRENLVRWYKLTLQFAINGQERPTSIHSCRLDRGVSSPTSLFFERFCANYLLSTTCRPVSKTYRTRNGLFVTFSFLECIQRRGELSFSQEKVLQNVSRKKTGPGKCRQWHRPSMRLLAPDLGCCADMILNLSISSQ